MTNKSRYRALSIPLLLLSTVMLTFCFYLLQVLEGIVHGDLYGYGLVFSYEWANLYWNIFNSIQNSILLSFIIVLIAIIFIIIHLIRKDRITKSICVFLILIKIFLAFFSLVSLFRLDLIVTDVLYNYGLQFSYEWANPYWNTIILLFGLFLAVIMLDVLSALMLISPDSKFYSSIKSIFRINSLLFLFGLAILFFSIGFNSTVLAFIGLGCVFWGAILFYIRSSRYIKEELLLTATKSSLTSLRQLILELGYATKVIYLPPKYLKDFESSKVFIPKTSKPFFPKTSQIQDKDTVIITSPKGLLLTPPGFDLSKLFEETLNINFTEKDLAFVAANLQKLIVDDLEIAQNIQMEIDEDLIHIKIENSVYRNMGTLSSALACVLTKTSGDLVIIENRETSEDGRIIDLYYRLIQSPI